MEELLVYAIAFFGLSGCVLGLYAWHHWVLADRMAERYKKINGQQREAISFLQEHCWALEDILEERRENGA